MAAPIDTTRVQQAAMNLIQAPIQDTTPQHFNCAKMFPEECYTTEMEEDGT